MSANTALMQSNVADALQRALEDTANEKGGKWGANGEAAATSGVIQFLQKYMRDDAKIIEKVKSGGKMKGAAAQLALTALEFANKCGGVELSFGGKVAAADDELQEEDAAPAATTETETKPPGGTQLRAHSAAINALVCVKKLYGKLKYLQVYKPRYYEKEYNRLGLPWGTRLSVTMMYALSKSARGSRGCGGAGERALRLDAAVARARCKEAAVCVQAQNSRKLPRAKSRTSCRARHSKEIHGTSARRISMPPLLF